jgi:hypothetical protein
MRLKTTAFAIVALTLLAGGSALFLNAHEQPRRPYPKASPPPPPSPIYTPSSEKAQSAEEIDLAAAMHVDLLLGQVGRALATRDAQAREAAFTFLLPELIQVAPHRVVELFEELEGEPRATLRTELACQWVMQDRDAAMRWLASLEGVERRDAAYAAVRTLAPVAPDQAIHVAQAFDIGRDDGFLAHLMQVWASDDIHQADRWMETQPTGPRTDELRVPLERARRQISRERG